MKAIVKGFVKSLLKRFGYKIVTLGKRSDSIPNDVPEVLFSPLNHERSHSEYDNIWSHPGFITKYLSASRVEFYRDLCTFIDSRTNIREITSVVDVGCGPLYVLKLLAELNPDMRLLGLDFSEEVLGAARAICPLATFRKHDIYEDLDEAFDLVVCSEILEHLDYPSKALDQLTLCARSIVLTVPNGRKDDYPGHINLWSMRSWELFLEPYAKEWECEACYRYEERKIATIMRRRA